MLIHITTIKCDVCSNKIFPEPEDALSKTFHLCKECSLVGKNYRKCIDDVLLKNAWLCLDNQLERDQLAEKLVINLLAIDMYSKED